MKKTLPIALFVMLFLAGICYWFYPQFYSPIYTWDQSQLTSKLISNDGSVYLQIGFANNEYKYGRQIGRTADKMRIYKVKYSDDKLMLTGLMMPQIIFKKE